LRFYSVVPVPAPHHQLWQAFRLGVAAVGTAMTPTPTALHGIGMPTCTDDVSMLW